jgi:hypothetical protein
MNQNTKAQGAMEFLMTYGWAFLVILIMIGALAYFGILSPTKLLPDKCLFTTPLACTGGELSIYKLTDGTLRLKLTNNFGTSIKVQDATISTDFPLGCTAFEICFDDNSDNQCTVADTDLADANPDNWPQGETKKIAVDCVGGNLLQQGEKVKFIFAINWFPGGSSASFKKPINGQLYSTPQ